MSRGSPAPQYKPPPPATPNSGVWTQQNGNWVWTSSTTATPDPNLVSQWGYQSLTDPRVSPSGTPGHGAWVQTGQHGRSGQPLWAWQWGASPDSSLAGQYGNGNLINPAWQPPGNGGYYMPNDPTPNNPAPPNVVAPNVSDAWAGVAPSVTGMMPASSGSQTVNQPPPHNPFAVSPGSIRNAEQMLLNQIDPNITTYDNLKSAVAQSASQNLATDPNVKQYLNNTQNQLLQQIADALQLAGHFTNALNYAAQNYAHADIASFVPQS